MTAYTVRVELKGDPSYVEYERLHALMAQLGFGRTVTGDKTVNLPHATYYGQSSMDVGGVRDVVQANVKTKIQSSMLVFVAKTETWAMGW
jgi:hypothetical protein